MSVAVSCPTELLNSAVKNITSSINYKIILLFRPIRSVCTVCTGVRFDVSFINKF